MLAATAAMASDVPTDGTFRFYGYAYDLATSKYLYTEVHEQHLAGGKWQGGSITYFWPDGRQLGHKTLSFSADPFIPVYRYEIPEQGYVEAISSVGDTIVMSKTTKADAVKTDSIERRPDMAADSGFHSFLRAHFADLMAGRTVPFVFIAAGNLDSYKFRAKRIDDTTWEGRKAVRFQVEANSLLRLVAPSLTVTYDPDTQRILEYRGISNVHDPATGKPFTARIDYYDQPPPDAPRTLPPLEQGS